MYSYWEKNYWLPEVDYCIIGAGIVGLSTALFLNQKYPSKSIAILERGALPSGASTKNAGFACYGTAGEILDDLKTIAIGEVKETVRMRYKGLQLLKSMIDLDAISYHSNGGYEVYRDKKQFEYCADRLPEVNELLCEVTGVYNTLETEQVDLRGNLYHKVIYNKHEGQLNPVKLVQLLSNKVRAQGILIHYSQELKSYSVSNGVVELALGTEELRCKCHKLILTTNAFTQHLIKHLDITPARNQVFITKPIPSLHLKGTFHYDKGYVYFRNVGDRVLIGGARNLVDSEQTTTDQLGINPAIVSYLKEFLRDGLNIIDPIIEHSWSGIIAVGNSKRPIIKQVGENVFVAVRLGGMGVATGSGVAQNIVDNYL